MNVATSIAACMLLATLPVAHAEIAGLGNARPAGLQTNVTFTDYSPLSRSTEVVRRMLTPLDALRVMQASTQAGKSLRDQAIDLSNEHFALYVPPKVPSKGYSLLVFVSPWHDGTVPIQWTSMLNRHDMIFVSAANSGNSANVLDRREPLLE